MFRPSLLKHTPSPLSIRSFHQSAPTQETAFKRAIRLKKKRLSSLKTQQLDDWFDTTPDPFLGVQLEYKNGVAEHEKKWRQTKIASYILDPQALWTTGPNRSKNVFTSLSSSPDSTTTTASSSSSSSQSSSDVSSSSSSTIYSPSNPIESFFLPPYMAHRLSNPEKEFLFSTLPYFTTSVLSLSSSPTTVLTPEEQARQLVEAGRTMEGERVSLEAMGRILSLRNASAQTIQRENVPRVIEAFGEPEVKSFQQETPRERKGPDTGSPEVQAALLTLRIRTLRTHLINHMHDTVNTTKLRHLAYKRKRILEYLKTLDRVRYDKCLMELGIEKRAVEGEVVIHKFWRQVPQTQSKSQKEVKYVGKVGKRGAIAQSKVKRMHPKRLGGQGLEAHY